MRPFRPFKFDHMELALIFVAWLIKTKDIIYRDLPNLSGENLVKAWVEMTAWFAIIYSKGGKHVEPIKVSAREAKFNQEIAKMKEHLVQGIDLGGAAYTTNGTPHKTYLMPKVACILRFTFDGYMFDHVRVKYTSPLLRSAETPSSGAHPVSRTS
ncbi:hypothetical protein FMUND_30 [Fusarium mundagurra]|uniref:Uncharacterized protein n=1 Tax=Fusarium mundagurra TaxID=1567541 RepID=A0A8H5Z6V9_9HYPO|nr:hypothetical protein FMUND_30 [Fusarium mundagurra]